jgi:hypothetical protein
VSSIESYSSPERWNSSENRWQLELFLTATESAFSVSQDGRDGIPMATLSGVTFPAPMPAWNPPRGVRSHIRPGRISSHALPRQREQPPWRSSPCSTSKGRAWALAAREGPARLGAVRERPPGGQPWWLARVHRAVVRLDVRIQQSAEECDPSSGSASVAFSLRRCVATARPPWLAGLPAVARSRMQARGGWWT